MVGERYAVGLADNKVGDVVGCGERDLKGFEELGFKDLADDGVEEEECVGCVDLARSPFFAKGEKVKVLSRLIDGIVEGLTEEEGKWVGVFVDTGSILEGEFS